MRRASSILVAVMVVATGFLVSGGPAPDIGSASEELGPDTLSLTPIPFPFPRPTCGGNVCNFGEYCCNPSCGTCTPIGAYCTQQVCAPTS